ncbi:MAG: hypothetical protein IT161_24555 [Bryobacterales bacterium]|nr:hypothetical protein [Bryobacterales bacterium]
MGGSSIEVSKIAGHSKPSTTLDYTIIGYPTAGRTGIQKKRTKNCGDPDTTKPPDLDVAGGWRRNGGAPVTARAAIQDPKSKVDENRKQEIALSRMNIQRVGLAHVGVGRRGTALDMGTPLWLGHFART